MSVVAGFDDKHLDFNHATYHRGHIEGVMYQLSIEPPATDIPVFIKLGK